MLDGLAAAPDQKGVADAYLAEGWAIFPVRGKMPLKGSRGLLDASSDPEHSEMWKRRFDLGIGLNCGESRLVVIDCDGQEGRDGWKELVDGRPFDTLVAVTPNNGRHFFFRLPPGVTVQSRNGWHPKIDVKSSGGYVVVPSQADPKRDWLAGTQVALAPEWLIEALEGVKTPLEAPTRPQARTMLSRLLSAPPKRGDGTTNEWCIQVFGHYAQRHRSERDLYEVHCQQAMDLVDPDYEDFGKCMESAWEREQSKGVEEKTREVDRASGSLLGDSRQLWCRVNEGDHNKPNWVMKQWADFDVVALGVTDNEEGGTRSYDLELHRFMRDDVRRVDMPASALADSRALTAFLVQHGVTIVPPTDQKGLGTTNARLTRYIEAQDPPRYRSVPHLGWHHGEFLTHEEVLFPDGPRPFHEVKPDPSHRSWAPFHYGFEGDREQAVDILREVLTFHDEQYVSVFAAWWAACWVKPRLPGQFPYLLIEAPSGHGKTTGFNPFMLQLAGNQIGQIFGTAAAIRDYLSGHNSGPVWVDDVNDTFHLEELLRQMTNAGAAVKKGEDRTGQVASGLVAPLILSGEGFPNLQNQRAQLDRAILLQPPNPTGRKSLHDPSQPQWADIEELQNRYPSLTAVAGHVAQAFLQAGHEMLSTARPVEPGGRFKEKLRVLRFGADLLAHVTGEPKWIDLVDAWCKQQVPVTENVVTLKVIPTALRQLGWPTVSQTTPGQPPNPAFVDGDLVFTNVPALADWWARYARQTGNGADPRTESAAALEQQLKTTDAESKVRRKGDVGGPANLAYWRLTKEQSDACLARSRGASVEHRQGASVQDELGLVTEMDYWVDPSRL